MTTFARIATDILNVTPQFVQDAEGSQKLQPALESLAQTGSASARRVALDLSKEEQMDRSGIGAFACLCERLMAPGHGLDFAGVHGQPQINSVLAAFQRREAAHG